MVAESVWTSAPHYFCVRVHPVAKALNVAGHIDPTPAIARTQPAIDFSCVTKAIESVLAEVNEQEEHPERLVRSSGAMAESNCLQRIKLAGQRI